MPKATNKSTNSNQEQSVLDDTNINIANQVKLLKSRNFQLFSELERFHDYINNFNVEQQSIHEMQARLDAIVPSLANFKKIQNEIDEIILISNENAFDRDESLQQRKEFEEIYYSAIANAKLVIECHKAIPSDRSGSSNISNLSTNITSPCVTAKLPLLKLPEFSGSYNEWQRFYDTFMALVHNNQTLANVEKFYYLQSSLKGEPANIIASLPISEANYATAFDLLKKRYENRKIIVNSHLKEIFEMPTLTKESHTALRAFLNTFLKNIRSLDALGEKTDDWGTMLLYLLASKLDFYTKREWENHSKEIKIPKIQDFTTFLTQRCQVLEALDTKLSNSQSSARSSTTKSFVSSSRDSFRSSITCPICKEQHYIYLCQKFRALTETARYEEVRRLNLCTNCLRAGHKTAECKSGGCKVCNKRHATLLHQSERKSNENASKSNQIAYNETKTESTSTSRNLEKTSDNNSSQSQVHYATTSNVSNNASDKMILLSTAIVNVYDSSDQPVPCRVLLDNGSQSNFITKRFARRLKLPIEEVNIPVLGINKSQTNIQGKIRAKISSLHFNFKTNIMNFLIIPTITELHPQQGFDASRLDIPPELPLADPLFNVPADVDMLLGNEIFFELLCVGQIRLGKNLPLLQKTLLGWIISGNMPLSPNNRNVVANTSLHCFHSLQDQFINIEKFWNIEEVDSNQKSSSTSEEIECENLFKETTTRNADGRFVVRLPLKNNFISLGDSRQLALNRLHALERRLLQMPRLLDEYVSFMTEYEELGHMSEVLPETNSDHSTPTYYLPYHIVEKPDSLTTKARVVFDASAKSSTNLSLNNVLKIGPTIQDDLFAILLRFRLHNVVFVGDLTKMYRQILIEPTQRDLQRIMWRKSPLEAVRHFQLNTITYGTASASFLATRCLKQIAIDNAELFPLEGEVIASDFYVDDILTGSTDVESLISLQQNITTILSKYGFEIRKFQSNAPELLNKLSENSEHEYIITDDNNTKTLGLSWKPSIDMFQYNAQQFDSQNLKVTKRNILSFISRIFDPLGLLGPLSIRAKLIIQQLWRLHISWDESLPVQIHSEWMKLSREIAKIGSLSIPRHVLTKYPRQIQLHGFSDASELAYGCCIYLRSQDNSGNIITRLLCAKSRVAPLKSTSIPRLELCAALLLARLVEKCKGSLKFKIENIYLWTDSTIVLHWITNESRMWKTFVANRVAEIQRITNLKHWRYVPSAANPADVISRGLDLNKLEYSNLWWHSPSFLSKPIEFWTKDFDASTLPKMAPNSEEMRMNYSSIMCINQEENFPIFDRFSNFSLLARVVAYCLRFINNVRNKNKAVGNLSVAEIEASWITLCKLVQCQAFSAEISCLKRNECVSKQSKLKALSPFLDANDIIRVGGRLKYSNLSYNSKHPIVLPSKHSFTKLVIMREHESSLHSGPNLTLSRVRQKYWPINGKQIVKSYLRKCVKCCKASPKNINPKMGNLPKPRVTPSRPFLSVGIDYAGPFDLKEGKSRMRKLVKAYVCIFICLAVKAVHIELITDLSADGFLSMLKRFVSRRGLCTDIYTDNATNFTGANNELINIKALTNTATCQNYLTDQRITWHFIPPRSPHFGGIWEAAVKSCKRHLNRVLNGTHLNYEEFYTLLTQIEAILNSRPLIPLSCDLEELEVLTPAHFLVGHQLTAVPERNWLDTKPNYVKRYRHLQRMGQHFWSRWSNEYLHHLQQRSKWIFDNNDKILIGSIVILKEDSVAPMKWPLGRVVEVHPGRDDIIRVVSVKTKNGILKRAVSKVCLLPVDVEESGD